MLAALEQIPLAGIGHRGPIFDEPYVDKVLARCLAVALVDEPARYLRARKPRCEKTLGRRAGACDPPASM